MPFIFKRYGSRKFIFYWLSEFILMFGIGLVAAHILLKLDNGGVFSYDPTFLKTIVLSLAYMTAFYYFDLYMPDMYRPGRNMFMRLISATFVATVALFAIFYIMPSLKTWRGILLLNIILMPLAVLIWRTLLTRIKMKELPRKNVLVIGTGDLAKKIGKDIYSTPDSGLKLVGFIDDDPSMLGVSIVNPGVVGGYGDIGSIAQTKGIDLIIVALADRRAKLPMYALLDCKLKGVQVEEGETFNERQHGNIPLNQLKPSWMVFSDGFKSLRSRKLVKRALDLVFAALLFVITSPSRWRAVIKLNQRVQYLQAGQGRRERQGLQHLQIPLHEPGRRGEDRPCMGWRAGQQGDQDRQVHEENKG
jgi:FlaA1/EpsC-like NDP-sugar epimerase